ENSPRVQHTRNVRSAAQGATHLHFELDEAFTRRGWESGLVPMALFPLLWALWAFLLRGGFTYRLAGIALLRSNGRKALRIQCAWRALVVWLPVVALLTLSFWLDCIWLVA